MDATSLFYFEDRPKLSPVIEGDLWELMEPWRFRYKDVWYTVPKGFYTDGASIPRFLWRVCGHPMTTTRMPVALAHDWAYSNECGGVFTRAQADDLYFDGLVSLDWPKWKARLEYAALRAFGDKHFQKD